MAQVGFYMAGVGTAGVGRAGICWPAIRMINYLNATIEIFIVTHFQFAIMLVAFTC